MYPYSVGPAYYHTSTFYDIKWVIPISGQSYMYVGMVLDFNSDNTWDTLLSGMILSGTYYSMSCSADEDYRRAGWSASTTVTLLLVYQ